MLVFRKIWDILLWVWQFPQHLCALVYLNRPFDKVDNPIKHYERHGWKYGGSVTLGEYIFTNANPNPSTLKHEYGHVVQSRMLGIFYLLVIGIPSIVHAWLHSRVCGDKSYYHFYTERWANKLSDKYFGDGVDKDKSKK